MPVARPNMSAPPVKGGSAIREQSAPVKVAAVPFEANYRATAVETRFEDTPALLSHIEGSPWILDLYLSQVLGEDSAVQGQQVSTHAIHQQYHAIVGMEIRVQSDLSHSQDESSSESTLTGSATIFPFLVPNKGDMFVARMFDGSVGIFQLTRSERLSVMRESAHQVEYILVGRNDQKRYDDLMRKIVRRSYFDRNFLYHGQNPILTEEAYDTVRYLSNAFFQIGRSYFDAFFSKEYATLVVPGQIVPTYDAFLVRAVLGFADQRLHDNIKYIRNLNTQEDVMMRSRSIWDVMRLMDRNLMYDIFTKAGIVKVTTFTTAPIFEGIRYSGIRNVVYPEDAPYNVDTGITRQEKFVQTQALNAGEPTRAFTAMMAKRQAMEDQLALDQSIDTVITPRQVTPDEIYADLGIKPLFTDECYIFSQAFYDNATEGQSRLEVLVNNFIDRKPIDQAQLRSIASGIHAWTPIERFYYTPFVLMLINSVIRML